MRYGTRYGSQIARDMTAGPPGGVSNVFDWRARDEAIAGMIAAGYARQEAAKAEAKRRAEAEAEAKRLTPAQRSDAIWAKYAAEAKRRAEVRKSIRRWDATHGPTPSVPEREPGSLARGRALWADQQRRRG